MKNTRNQHEVTVQRECVSHAPADKGGNVIVVEPGANAEGHSDKG